jgi:hypothetical protein
MPMATHRDQTKTQSTALPTEDRCKRLDIGRAVAMATGGYALVGGIVSHCAQACVAWACCCCDSTKRLDFVTA